MSDVELTNAQFERLVGMLAENRVAIRDVHAEVMQELRASEARIKQELGFMRSAVDVIDADLTKVQSTLREHGGNFSGINQALDGITQLCKTNFDMNESILKLLHGEGSHRLKHVEAEENRGNRTQ